MSDPVCVEGVSRTPVNRTSVTNFFLVPTRSVLVTVGGTITTALGIDLITFSKVSVHHNKSLVPGGVLTGLGIIAIARGQWTARPSILLKGMIVLSIAFAIAGVATVQIGAGRYHAGVGTSDQNTNIFVGGAIAASVGSSVFLSSLGVQYHVLNAANFKMIANLSAAAIVAGSCLIIGGGAMSYGDVAWARSLCGIIGTVALAVVFYSAAYVPHVTADDTIP